MRPGLSGFRPPPLSVSRTHKIVNLQLGRELDLFDSDPLIGAGLPIWLPAGAAARHEVESYLYDLERRAGYRHVYSPALGKREMFDLSGHRRHFAGDMFPAIGMGDHELVL